MKLFLSHREQVQSLGSFLVSELDSMVARIRGAWNVEHRENDQHGHVHAQSLATGRLTFSDIASATVAVASVNDYEPAGLSTAALLRLTTTLTLVSVTGLRFPQDETGAILDGRVLMVENASLVGTFVLEHESTLSLQGNRFVVPSRPEVASTLTNRFVIPPGSLVCLIYNAALARWLVQSKDTNDVLAYVEPTGTTNDYAPTGYRAAKVITFSAGAATLLSGLSRTDVPAGERKFLSNVGLLKAYLLHANTGSVAANRFYCPGGVRYALNPRETVEIVAIEGGGWRIAEKADQWIDVAYSAGDYLASSGTWTVDSADLVTLAYQIDGNRMTVSFRMLNTDVSATPTTLTFPIPNGRTAARTMRNTCTIRDAGATEVVGRVEVTAAGTTIAISKLAGAAFTATAGDNTDVVGEITFMVRDASASISELHTDVSHGDTAHSDSVHLDVPHADVAHGDSHGDTSHTDSSHTDSHSDVAHTDSHSDVAHTDSHSDVAHADSHDDVAHADTHSDLAHGDSGGGVHNDEPHEDSHGDTLHTDSHSDVAHADSHDDTHTDSHSDVAHTDSHGDQAHVDGGHSDSHSDTPSHSDTSHVDQVHSDTSHADALHQDVGQHVDTDHADI